MPLRGGCAWDSPAGVAGAGSVSSRDGCAWDSSSGFGESTGESMGIGGLCTHYHQLDGLHLQLAQVDYLQVLVAMVLP